MTEPASKTPEMWNALNKLSESISGRAVTKSIEEDICWSCGKKATEFKDRMSYREFKISGLCQECQDKVFVEEE